jgi:CHASE3 domain sensor protein
MRTIESSARGFVVTGEDSYLGDYRFSILRAAQDQELFGTLTVDNLNQQRRLPDLTRLAAAKIQLAEALIGLRRDQGFDAAVDATRKGAGQRLMNDFMSVVDGAKIEELRLLTIRDADSQSSQRQAKFGLILATVLGSVIAATAGWRYGGTALDAVRRKRRCLPRRSRLRSRSTASPMLLFLAMSREI